MREQGVAKRKCNLKVAPQLGPPPCPPVAAPLERCECVLKLLGWNLTDCDGVYGQFAKCDQPSVPGLSPSSPGSKCDLSESTVREACIARPYAYSSSARALPIDLILVVIPTPQSFF
jgi:hypothetical protein